VTVAVFRLRVHYDNVVLEAQHGVHREQERALDPYMTLGTAPDAHAIDDGVLRSRIITMMDKERGSRSARRPPEHAPEPPVPGDGDPTGRNRLLRSFRGPHRREKR